MSVSLRAAIKNIAKDKDFLSKYLILVILSFTVGLTFFASYAKNYALVIPSSALGMLASIILCGYDFRYLKKLINNTDANLPEWNNFGELLITGLKFFGTVFLLAVAIIAVVLVLTILSGLTVFISKGLAFSLLIGVGVLNIIICACLLAYTPAIIYNFIDTDYDLAAIFNFKKLSSYFSRNYFSAFFAGGFVAILVSIFAIITTAKPEYVLLYIIPLMIAPIVRMINDNLLIQAYTANKANEKGSAVKLILYFILSLITLLGWAALCYCIGKIS